MVIVHFSALKFLEEFLKSSSRILEELLKILKNSEELLGILQNPSRLLILNNFKGEIDNYQKIVSFPNYFIRTAAMT